MNYNGLVKDLKSLVAEMKQAEEHAQRNGYNAHYSGLLQNRVRLEETMREHGIQLTNTLTPDAELLPDKL